MVKKILTQWFAMIAACFGFLVGKISWNTPPWINYLRNKAKAKPKVFWGISVAILFFLATLLYGYHWYQSLPKPQLITAKITPPNITPNDKILTPDNLSIDFGIATGGELNHRSVAPLHLVGKEITQGISMTPTIPGKWVWESDSRLVFTPTIDWPAGQTYTVTFSKDFFASTAKMESLHDAFQTLPFEGVITEFKFYQDPLNPQLRQAVATINFSYPIDPASLENRISLQFQALKNGKQNQHAERFKYTVDYDTHKRIVYIRSESLSLPPVERYLELMLAKGLKPIAGPSRTLLDMDAKVLIPDAGSYLKVTSLTTSIVRNPQDRPEQVLTLETSIGVTETAFNKSLHAYLLPKDYPATAAEKAKPNYQWQDPGEVTPAILALSQPLTLQSIPADHDYATLHSYKYNAVTPAFIYVKVDKGMSGLGHFNLSNDYVALLKAPSHPQEIAFLHKGSLLALGTEEKLSVLVRGLAAVKFNFARVLPDDVNHLVTQTSGNFSSPYFVDPNFSQQNISEIFSQVQQFDATNPGKEQYTALDLSNYFPAKTAANHALGLFLLQARGWDTNKNMPLDVQSNRLVLITDLGLLVKDNNDGTHDLFVQSINQGTPVNAATVAILGKNGLPLLTRTTDTEGHVNFPTLHDFTNEREPTVYLVRNGNDVSFIPYNRADRQLNYSRFDIGGITSNPDNQTALTAYLFSDRGIYRPFDVAHIAMIVKKPYVSPETAGLPLEVTVTDPRGVTVKNEKIILNESGYLTLDFQTSATAPTGQYLVNLYIVKDNHPSSQIGSTPLHVAEFLPDRMRITAHLSNEQPQGWVSPSELTAKISLWNLYGAPAADHRIGGKILLAPQTISFKAFPHYIFVDPLFDPKSPPKVFTDTLTDTRTNAQGQAELDLKLDRFEKATYKLTVFAEGFEAEGGRSVTTQTSALVSPLAYLVGYRADGDLNYIKQNSARGIHFIAINPQLKQQSLSNLKIQLYDQQPITTLVKKANGIYQYQSLIQSKEIKSEAYAITDQGVDFTLPTEKIGDFAVAIVDQHGTELSRFNYKVVGNSQQPLPKNAELTIKLNKSEFTPGEEIEMQVTAPYTGTGLITIERDKVHAFQWFKTNTTASMQKIRIPNDFQGNGYVNIAFVRDLNSADIFTSPLSYSVIPFSVTHKNHDMQIDLTTSDLARPGDLFAIHYKTDKPGKIIVFAVDEGILQVSQYQSPNPLEFFFRKQALEVNTSQILDQILPKFIADRELSAVGGDGGESALNKNLNPFKRKTEAPVVYWSGIVDADTTPQQLTYQIPDYFNGTLRVMAVAVAADAVGSASKATEVRGYFVINPNVPTFVAPGDEFDVSVSVANNVEGSGDNANVTLVLSVPEALEIIGTTKQTIVIPEKQERSVHFKLRAKSQLGSAELKFMASLNDKSSKMSSTLSVRPATPYFTSVMSGYTTNANQSLTLDRVLYPEYRTVEAAVSPSPLILVVGLQQYLNEYPYGCTEQLVSKAFPLLAMANQPWFATDTKTITDKIQQTIQMLSLRQMSSGGFNYWPEVGTTYGNDFASVYTMHFLTEAKTQGYAVPSSVFSAGIGFLRDLAMQNVTDLDQARIHAYAIYILTRNEIITTNYLTNLQLFLDQHPDFNWHHDITSVYIATTYQLLKNSADADRILNNYKPLAEKANATTDFYNENLANAQYLYLIARHFPDRLLKLDDKLVMALVNTLNNDTMSTLLSGYSSLALAAYGQFYPAANNAALSINEVMLDGKQNTVSSSNDMYQKVIISDSTQKIMFNNPSKQAYFYQLTQAGFDKNLPKEALQQGIEVYREYRDADNKELTTVSLGNEVVVHIRARATDNAYHDNVALVDLLPGGFEVVNHSVSLQGIDYADIREDRVLFFASITPESKEITYRIRATNIGNYIVPPMLGISMYHPLIKSLGLAGKIVVGKE